MFCCYYCCFFVRKQSKNLITTPIGAFTADAHNGAKNAQKFTAPAIVVANAASGVDTPAFSSNHQ